jgi:C1A family cysteine protease
MKKFKGCRFDPFDDRDLTFSAGRITLPRAVDNRKAANPIRNQGNEGSCVGFAVAKTLEMAFAKITNRPDLSERWAYEYAKKYDEWPGENYEGSSVRGGLKAANKMGVCTEPFWPYKPNNRGTPKAKAEEDAEEHKVIRYTRVSGIDNVKAAIHKHGAVCAAALVHEGWLRPRNAIIPMNPKFGILGGHAFVLVGYGRIGFWVANSWGRRWGRRGFAALHYKDAKVHLMDAWTIQVPDDNIKPAPIKKCKTCGRPL